MYGEEDIMSQTQSQEELPLGQQSQATKNAVKEEQLQKAKKKFNDNLIVKNNQEHSDKGIREVLLALEKDNASKILKQLRKPALLATLGFLHRMGFEEAKEKFKDLLVDNIRNDLLSKYDLDSPQKCRECQDIYNIGETLEYKDCFICCRRMCPTCIPASSWGIEDPPKGLLPVCFSCEDKYSRKKSKEGNKEVATPETPTEATVRTPQTPETLETPVIIEQPKRNVNTVDNSETKTRVCRHYVMNKCKHGKAGEECKDSHPKLCYGFINKGKEGCPRQRNKEECPYHHPSGCRYGSKCKNDKCNYFHTKAERKLKKKATETPPPVETKAEESQAKETPKEATEVKETPVQAPAVDFQVAKPPVDTSQMLLCLMESMKEMTKNVNILIQNQNWAWGYQFQPVTQG